MRVHTVWLSGGEQGYHICCFLRPFCPEAGLLYLQSLTPSRTVGTQLARHILRSECSDFEGGVRMPEIEDLEFTRMIILWFALAAASGFSAVGSLVMSNNRVTEIRVLVAIVGILH